MAKFEMKKLNVEEVYKARASALTKAGIDIGVAIPTTVWMPFDLKAKYKYTDGICTTRNYNLPPFRVHYEEITAVAWNNQRREVSATICLKLPWGFGGQAPQGSYEYVSFFVNWAEPMPPGVEPDYTDWFEYVGTESLLVYDNPHRNEKMHTSFHVTHKVSPPAFCMTRLNPPNGSFVPNPPRIAWIRGVLSWVTPVDNPWQVPVWGNWFDAKIELAPVF